MLDVTKTLPTLLTQKQAAEYLCKSPKWLERDRWLGPTIPYVKIGRAVRYRAADLESYLELHRVEVAK